MVLLLWWRENKIYDLWTIYKSVMELFINQINCLCESMKKEWLSLSKNYLKKHKKGKKGKKNRERIAVSTPLKDKTSQSQSHLTFFFFFFLLCVDHSLNKSNGIQLSHRLLFPTNEHHKGPQFPTTHQNLNFCPPPTPKILGTNFSQN